MFQKRLAPLLAITFAILIITNNIVNCLLIIEVFRLKNTMNHCRVCLASELTFKFDSIFDEDGKCAEEIFLLSGLRVSLFFSLKSKNLEN